MQTRLHRGALALVTAALMSACGGGGSDDDNTPPPVQEVPDSALASPAAFTAFSRGLAVSEGGEPMTMARVDIVPTSETDEPASLD